MHRESQAQPIPTGRWGIEAATSRVGFSVRHLGVATVKGAFKGFEGSVTTGSSGLSGASGVVQVASIDTGEPKRDRNLRGPDFFDAAAHPSIRFVSRGIEGGNGSRARIIGELTIKGITRDFELVETELRCRNGAGGSDSPQRIEIQARGEISRREFDLA